MKPTQRMFQVFLVRNNQSSPSRWFPNEQQARFFCSEFNRIVEEERQTQALATYQPVEIERRQRSKHAWN